MWVLKPWEAPAFGHEDGEHHEKIRENHRKPWNWDVGLAYFGQFNMV